MAVGAALSRVLAAERKALNARVGAARVRTPGFDLAGFTVFLEQQVDPLASAINALDADATHRCVVALFDMGLDLVGHGLGGASARAPVVNAVWNQIAPHILTLIIADPVESLGVLTNAAVQLSGIDGVRLDSWLATMAQLAGRAADNHALRALAAVAAWLAGAAHYREAALGAAATLPCDLACAAAGAGGSDWNTIAAGFASNHWWRPGDRSQGYLFGGFTGFGGRFSQPPRVRAAPQGFLVASGDLTLLLVADAYGATLHPALPQEFASAPALLDGSGATLSGHQVIAGGRTIDLDWPEAGLALACNQDSIAVTSPYAHAIHLLPRLPG
ncbi:MAG: hypothetical protein RL367_504 [Pseudomonadota bacterium]|jgi:hypothetical protein